MGAYYNMSIPELQKEVEKLNHERNEIVDRFEKNEISETYAQKLYAAASKKWGNLSMLLEKKLAAQHSAFVSCFIK